MIKPCRALADRPGVRQVRTTTPISLCSMSHLHDTCQRLPTPRPELRKAGPSFLSPQPVVRPTISGCSNFSGAPVPNNGIPILGNGIQLSYGYNPVNAVPITATHSPPCPVSPLLKVPFTRYLPKAISTPFWAFSSRARPSQTRTRIQPSSTSLHAPHRHLLGYGKAASLQRSLQI